ncbi:hypothetical protein M0R45_025917 [Rubus argutus]|uniref:Uncharacterized protein n=1 Tax=Rubus argutus TaxID=59490 RepID=A0AAW1WWP0_RUBAR
MAGLAARVMSTGGAQGMVKLRVLFGLIDFELSLSRGSIESTAGRFAGWLVKGGQRRGGFVKVTEAESGRGGDGIVMVKP